MLGALEREGASATIGSIAPAGLHPGNSASRGEELHRVIFLILTLWPAASGWIPVPPPRRPRWPAVTVDAVPSLAAPNPFCVTTDPIAPRQLCRVVAISAGRRRGVARHEPGRPEGVWRCIWPMALGWSRVQRGPDHDRSDPIAVRAQPAIVHLPVSRVDDGTWGRLRQSARTGRGAWRGPRLPRKGAIHPGGTAFAHPQTRSCLRTPERERTR
jgi:hypothetical protein